MYDDEAAVGTVSDVELDDVGAGIYGHLERAERVLWVVRGGAAMRDNGRPHRKIQGRGNSLIAAVSSWSRTWVPSGNVTAITNSTLFGIAGGNILGNLVLGTANRTFTVADAFMPSVPATRCFYQVAESMPSERDW